MDSGIEFQMTGLATENALLLNLVFFLFLAECSCCCHKSVVVDGDEWLGRCTCDLRVAGLSPGHDTAWLFLR